MNKRELAKILGVTEGGLTIWQQAGMPIKYKANRKGVENDYDLKEVVAWRIESEIAKRVKQTPKDQLDLIRAKREELNYRRDLGEMIRTEDLRPVFQRYVADILAVLLAIPDKYAQTLEMTMGAEGKHAILRELIEEIRDILGNYEQCTKAPDGRSQEPEESAEDNPVRMGGELPENVVA